MEKSEKFNFYLPSRDGDDIVDVNQLSDNFRIIDETLLTKDEYLKLIQETFPNGDEVYY